MKVEYIKAERKITPFNKIVLEKIKDKEIDILYAIQYKKIAKKVRDYLVLKGKRVKLSNVLGCSEIKSKNTILLISDGKFHSSNISSFSNKEILVFNGEKLEKISKEEIEKHNSEKKAKLSKLLFFDETGIIVSIKKGQERLKEAFILKKKLEKKKKKVYLFICDNLSELETENFTLPIYVNMACPGIEKDNKKLINYRDIIPYF